MTEKERKIELISFDLCPFVQRSIITLLKKDVEHEITFIDLKNKPEWFLNISPMGKVPVLKTGGEVLFESAVINEYLDETTEGSLLPTDSLQKAKSRAWIEFSSALLMTSFGWMMAKDEDEFVKLSETLSKQLAKLEEQLPGGSFFNGSEFSLVDSSLAPLLMRLEIIDRTFGNNILKGFPKISQLTTSLLAQDYVKKSVIPIFEIKFLNYLKIGESFVVKELKVTAVV
jgi:glutathione S-transferase